MSYQPPFKITSSILNLVSLISEKIGELKTSYNIISPQLRKKNKIKTITGTLQIEGNTLTEEQVSAVLDGKRVLGTMRELSEVQGAIKTYEQLSQLDPLSLDDLLKAHGWLMGEILIHAGHFRTKGVGIHQGEKIIHVAPPAHRVSGLMADLFQWLEQSEDHPLIVSSVFHYEFEFIHPFIDGNGRMGRLWQTLLLSNWKAIFKALPLESVVRDHQQEYYQALAQSDRNADATAFIVFMLEAILTTIDKNVPVNVPVNALVNIKGLKTPEAIVKLISANQNITRNEMAEKTGKDVRTIGRAIKKLQQDNKLRRVGSDKSGYWELL
ncbi:MAG: Fic family protein [Thermodesulfobacteriota bacterium]|nr:Fic family protein [Thermodesulfobacteriota bacterium]